MEEIKLGHVRNQQISKLFPAEHKKIPREREKNDKRMFFTLVLYIVHMD